MIAYLKGKLVRKEPAHIIVDVQGVGYYVHISLHTFSEIKDREDILIHTHLHVKEDSHALYGFHDEKEKKMFLNLTSVSGVGNSTALAIQSSLSAPELREAILSEDVKTIQSVKGIGTKTAQRLILELKDKIGKEGYMPENGEINVPTHTMIKNEALSALTTLGINKTTAEKTIDSILKNSEKTISLEELIKLSLKNT